MTRMIRVITILLGAAAVTFPSIGSEIEFRIAPAASTVTFTLGATLHTVEGSFEVESGFVKWNPDEGEVSGEIVIDATSGETGIGRRDRKMHDSVLKSDQYPRITFRPARIEGTMTENGQADLTVHGDLTLLGQDHEISVPVSVQWGDERAEVSATMTIPYVSWGLNDPSTFLLRVDQSVDVEVSLKGPIRVNDSD